MCACECLCAAIFHFHFCCVYPADSPQSVDKEPAMTAGANVAELLERLTEKVKLMAVNSKKIARHNYRDSMAESCTVNENISSDQSYKPGLSYVIWVFNFLPLSHTNI